MQNINRLHGKRKVKYAKLQYHVSTILWGLREGGRGESERCHQTFCIGGVLFSDKIILNIS